MLVVSAPAPSIPQPTAATPTPDLAVQQALAVQQLLQLTPDQIDALPPVERAQVLELVFYILCDEKND